MLLPRSPTGSASRSVVPIHWRLSSHTDIVSCVFDSALVHAVLDLVPDAVIDGGWGVDALVGRQTRGHDDLDLVIDIDTGDSTVAALGGLGFELTTDERPTRVVLSGGMTQRLPGGKQFTYVLDDTTGVIDGRTVPCLSPDMQILTHSGYEPDDDDRADVALVAAGSGRALPPPYADPLGPGQPVPVRTATVDDVAAACIVRLRSWRVAYAGLMPQPVIDALDLGTMWSTWRASVSVPASAAVRLFVAGPPGSVHAYTWVRPTDSSGQAAEVAAMYSDPTVWGSAAGWSAFATGVEFLRAHGYTELSLWMLKGNERAGRFYERAGWFPDGEEKAMSTAVGSYVEVRYRPVES
jgi:RimJ/RimL family protein N-acetyltransferase